MKFKFINFIIIIMLIIITGGIMYGQQVWVVKISDLVQIDMTIYEEDVIKTLENAYLFQRFFPNPMAPRQPLTEDIFSFKEKIQEQLENIQQKKALAEQYISSILFQLRAEALGLYNKNKLEQQLERFYLLMEFEVTKVVYMVKGLLPKAEPTQERIDWWFDKLKAQAEQYGQQVSLDKLEELSINYAKDEEVQRMLMEAVNKKTGEKIIMYDENDPFLVKIDGQQIFTQKEVEMVFKAFIDYTAYILQGGVVEDSDIEEQYTKKDLKKQFIITYVNYHLMKEIAQESNVYDEKLIKELAQRFTNFFKTSYLTIRYTKKILFPEVEKQVTDEMIEKMVKQLKSDPRFKDQSDEWLYNYAKNYLYKQLLQQLQQQEVQKIRGMYKIIYNDDYFG